jgi:hypothetical protein
MNCSDETGKISKKLKEILDTLGVEELLRITNDCASIKSSQPLNFTSSPFIFLRK